MRILTIFIRMNRQNAKMYYYGGHGNDVCDPRTRVPIVRIVPENCIYITIAECGFKTKIQGGEEEFFRSKLTRFLLRNPDMANHKEDIARAMKRSKHWLHIHMPGTPYVVSHFHPFGFWHNDIDAGLAVSGLAEKSLLENLGEKSRYFLKPSLHTTVPLSGNVILEKIRRNAANPVKRDAKVAKAISMMQGLYRDYGDSMFQPNFVNRIFIATNVVATKEELLDYFEASVYPTKEEVSGFLEEQFPGKELFFSSEFAAIDEFIHLKMNPEHRVESDPMYPLSNTYMMEYFPGIHYNVVCREVGPGCYPGLQRTLSGIQEAEREGQEYPIIPSKTYAQLKAEIEGIVSRPLGSFKQKSIDLKKYLSQTASDIYVLPVEQKEVLFQYLLTKGYIRANNATQTVNSNIMKYYIRPNKYRIEAGGSRKTRKRKTRKNLSS